MGRKEEDDFNALYTILLIILFLAAAQVTQADSNKNIRDVDSTTEE